MQAPSSYLTKHLAHTYETLWKKHSLLIVIVDTQSCIIQMVNWLTCTKYLIHVAQDVFVWDNELIYKSSIVNKYMDNILHAFEL